jgi:acetyl esterase/lipase
MAGISHGKLLPPAIRGVIVIMTIAAMALGCDRIARASSVQSDTSRPTETPQQAKARPSDIASNRRALALFVHGGGWVAGDSTTARLLAGMLRQWGLDLASVDYRMPPAVGLGVSVADVRSAVIKYQSQSSTPLVVIGHSAGAELAAAAVLGANDPAPTCLVLLDGSGYDLPQLLESRPGLQKRLNLTPEAAGKLSPIELLHPRDRTVRLFIAAGRDSRNTKGAAQELSDRALKEGISVVNRYYPSMDHRDFIRDFIGHGTQFTSDVHDFIQSCLRDGTTESPQTH